MSITTVLILNNVALGLGVVAIVALFWLLMKAEYKLAKHNESWMFKKKKK